MSLTNSEMVNLGKNAPEFTLYDTVSSNSLSLKELRGDKGTVIMFICNHCPFVKHINKIIVETANQYISAGISFIAISSNDAEKFPEDGPEQMIKSASENNYPFPYLYDATQEVAKAYGAVCTPDIFVYNEELSLVYRGRIDDSRPGKSNASANELKGTLRALVANQLVSEIQYPSIGCNIKWK
ncbi:MAG: peroxiredoxin [Oceanospirillaceae bacterium]|jgi:peroxiredoxin